MSRKTPLTSIFASQSKAEFISLTIDNYFEIMNHQGENQAGIKFCKKLILMEMIKKVFKNDSFINFGKN